MTWAKLLTQSLSHHPCLLKKKEKDLRLIFSTLESCSENLIHR